jgi:hypothetical protein
MSFALGTGMKLGGSINHIVLVSFGRCVVLDAGVWCPLALWCTGSLFAMDFLFVSKRIKNKKKLKIIWEFGGVFGILESSQQVRINRVDFIFFRFKKYGLEDIEYLVDCFWEIQTN